MKTLFYILGSIILLSAECNKKADYVYVAGHLVESDNQDYVQLLGPNDVAFSIEKDDIINVKKWERSFDNVIGKPKIITLKKTAKVIEGSNELYFTNQRRVTPEAGCECEVPCNGASCCAIGGWKTECRGRSCVTTTERC